MEPQDDTASILSQTFFRDISPEYILDIIVRGGCYPYLIFETTKNEIWETLTCTICQGVFNEAMTDGCSPAHVFGKACINKATAHKKLCPLSRAKYHRDTLRAGPAVIKSLVDTLDVKCFHFQAGCSWSGQVKDLKGHMMENCDRFLIECQLCTNDIKFKNIGEHDKNCPEKAFLCNNNCGNVVKNKELKNHLEYNCPHELVPCEFVNRGCQDKIMRKDLEAHNIDCMSHHLKMVMEVLEKLENKNSFLEKENEFLNKKIEDLNMENQNLIMGAEEQNMHLDQSVDIHLVIRPSIGNMKMNFKLIEDLSVFINNFEGFDEAIKCEDKGSSKSFSFDFSGKIKGNFGILFSFIEKFQELQQKKELKNVRFCLSNNELNNAHLKILLGNDANALKGLTSVRKLTLILENNKLSQKGMHIIKSFLLSCSELRKLELNLNENMLKGEDLVNLLNNLHPTLSKLRSVSVHFQRNQVDDYGVQQVCKYCMEEKGIKQLMLNLNDNPIGEPGQMSLELLRIYLEKNLLKYDVVFQS